MGGDVTPFVPPAVKRRLLAKAGPRLTRDPLAGHAAAELEGDGGGVRAVR